MGRPNRRPNTKTLKKVFAWLEEHSMSVYGPGVDLETGREFGGCMDVDADGAIKLAKLLKGGKTWYEGGE